MKFFNQLFEMKFLFKFYIKAIKIAARKNEIYIVYYLLSKRDHIPDLLFECCYALVGVIIPSTIKTIGKKAFFKCKSITNVLIPEECTLIDEYCFASCSELKEINIPASVTRIGNSCFSGCAKLEKITFDPFSKITTIEPCTFYYCASIKEIIFPSSVRVFDKKALFNMSNLIVFKALKPSSDEVQDENKPSYIGEECFAKCFKLKTIELPNSITYIEGCAFSECKSIEKISFLNCTKLKKIYTYAFYDEYNRKANQSIKEIELPPSLEDFEFKRFIESFKKDLPP